MYGYVPVDSLSGNILVIKVHEYVDNISSSSLRRDEIKNLAGPQDLWPSDIFYVNHYYMDRRDMNDNDDVA